ncbi:MAG: hypothetical protein AAFX79_13175 [Planctomycetota bacterium]
MSDAPVHHDEHDQHDDWFAHSREEGLPQRENGSHISTRGILVFYAGMVVFVVVCVVGVGLFYGHYMRQVRQDKIETLNLAREANAYRDESLEALESYGWAEETGTRVRVPIAEARDRVLAGYGTGGG